MSKLVKQIKDKFAKEGIESFTYESMDWYRKFIKTKYLQLPGIKLLREYKKATRLFRGMVYSFNYDPKLKDVLPYYDTFPLVLILEIYEDGFLGLNMHYVSPRYRYLILLGLLVFLTDDKMDGRTRLRITYQRLNALKISKYTGNMIKRYLYDHIQTPIYKIPIEDWEIIIALPYDNFEGATRQQVYKDMLK